MIARQEPLPIQEFDVPIRNTVDARIIGKLKEPVRDVGRWYQRLNPPQGWYDRVFSGDLSNKIERERFKAEYNRRAQLNPRLRDPYTFIDRGWHSRNIVWVAGSQEVLGGIRIGLLAAAREIEEIAPNEHYMRFADCLDTLAGLLPEGKFSEAMSEIFLKMPPEVPIKFQALPVEYQDDPLGERVSPQGLLAYAISERTRVANEDIARYSRAAVLRHGVAPIQADACIADAIIMSGWLGFPNRVVSAFNLPNYPSDRAVIYLFQNRIAKKNQEVLTPGLEDFCGIRSADIDIEIYTLAHEYSHGKHYDNEARRLGSLRAALREGWATYLALVLEAAATGFPAEHTRNLVVGAIAFARNDIGPLAARIKEPYGVNQPSVDEILARGPYAAGEYPLLRRASTDGGLPSWGVIEPDKFLAHAEQYEPLYAQVAATGVEEDVRKLLEALVAEKRFWSVDAMVKRVFTFVKARLPGSSDRISIAT